MLKKIIIFISCFFIFLFSQDSKSQQKIETKSNNEPVEIFAEEGIEWDQNKKKYIASGKAVAKKGLLTVKSDKLEAAYVEKKDSENEITRLIAKGNVFIKNDITEIVGGKNALYDLKKEYFLVQGKNLKLTSNDDELTANSKIEFWKIKNIAVATGNAKAYKEKKYTISADKLIWHLIETKNGDYEVIKILAYENVILKTNNEIAYSNKALYNKTDEICKLFGNVKLNKGENFLTGEYAEMNINSGISKLLPYPKNTPKKDEKRVKALIKKNEPR